MHPVVAAYFLRPDLAKLQACARSCQTQPTRASEESKRLSNPLLAEQVVRLTRCSGLFLAACRKWLITLRERMMRAEVQPL